ncbi:MAG: PAS domain-containing protein, partial [Ignavibacteria bacterium]|nr:PAS domain-containing protein [Ignavibacteria bacterium]
MSIQYKGGKAIIGTVIDVTDRNKLIEDIKNANNRYDLIVESSNAIVYDYNVSSGEIQWGGTVYKVLGYQNDEFSGGIKQWESLIHPDDRDEAIRLLQEAEDSGNAYDVEYRFKKKDGKYIWFYDRGFFIYDREGRATRMLGMMQDITARKEFEFELQRERDLFTGGPVIIFRWKREEGWPVEYVSKNIEQYGYSREDFISGKIKYASIIHPDDLERIAREVEYYTKNNFKNFEQYYRIRKANGDYIELYDFTVTIKDENGEIAYYDGYVFDITELKNAESELKRQKDFLRTIIDTDPNFIFVKDWDGKFTLVNKAVADVYGT